MLGGTWWATIPGIGMELRSHQALSGDCVGGPPRRWVMWCVVATREMTTATAADLATMGSTLDTAHEAAAASTVAVEPAAADEVSGSIAHLFSHYAQDYQALAV